MCNLTRAIEVACHYHANQEDRQGKPYILHCLRVGMAFKDEQYQIVGVLHDILEDTTIDIAYLKVLVTGAALQAIIALTRTHRETYEEYIEAVARNPIALRVKIVDLLDNLSRMHELTEKEQQRLRPRYSKALNFLRQKLIDQGTDMKDVFSPHVGV